MVLTYLENKQKQTPPPRLRDRDDIVRALLNGGDCRVSVRIPGQGGHDSGVNPVTDSDFKPVTLSHLSEP